ncbi:hypothetical protein IFM89_013536 [Coptis chinensis]|uniref:RNase H type-1 domain-containing protein n=1 Tax=Coptis chinensis TaxID=261450 RepID=A0A835H2S3_9MAGN|nr:hypothetical protein IFM89_013536 [Coptis chinensis]
MFVEHTQAAEVIAKQTTPVVVSYGNGASPQSNNRGATNSQAKRGRGRPKGFGNKRGRDAFIEYYKSILGQDSQANCSVSQLVTPKHPFTSWQLFSGSLLTQDRIKRELGLIGTVKGSNAKWFDILQTTNRKSIQADILKAFKISLQGQLKEIKDSTGARVLMQKLGIQTQFVSKVPVTCTWASLEADEVTLNPDGSVSNNGSSYGGLVRNSEGGVHFMYKGCNRSSSVLVQELREILQGLKGCKMMGFRKVKVASDSLRAVCILLGSESAP